MSSNTVWKNPLPAQFSDAVFRMASRAELQDFLRDAMTEKEIIEISARFEAARLLEQNISYVEIAKQTNLSSRTIARISDWLQNGTGGYKNALAHHAHISPVRAE